MNQPDYDALWRAAWMAAKGAGQNPYDRTEKAQEYDRSASIRADGERRALELPINAGTTVLDIGSGPGTLAVPLARRGAVVTAVEPSAAMRELLLRRQQEDGVADIRLIPHRWETLSRSDLGQFDLVIASYSLSFPNLADALRKMNDVARQNVSLFWFAGRASWEQLLADLREAVTREPFYEQPKSDLIYGCLCQMGFSPAIQPLEDTSFCYDYPTLHAAVENLRRRLGVVDTTQDQRLADYIKKQYQPLSRGGWRFVDRTRYVRISWTPKHSAEEARR